MIQIHLPIIFVEQSIDKAMQSVTYRLDASELDERLIDSIKSLFKSGRVMVTVEPDEKEITNIELLEKIKKNQSSAISYVFEGDAFDEISRKLLEDRKVDLKPYTRVKS